MDNGTSRLHPKQWAGAVFFGVLSYLCIVSFEGPSRTYNATIAGYVLAAAGVLMLFLLHTNERLSTSAHTLRFICAAVLSMSVSVWMSSDTRAAIDRAALYYAVALLGLSIYMLQRGGPLPAVVSYFAAIAVVHVAILAPIVLWLIDLRGGESALAEHVPYHSNVRHFAYHGFLAAASATAAFMLSRRLAVAAFALTVAALFGIVLLGARGALYSWLIFVGCAAIFSAHRTKLLAFAGAALLLSVAMAYQASAMGLAAHVSLFARAEAGASVVYQSAGRWPIWLDTFQAILERPWFGYGPEGYYFSRCCNPRTVQPHNFVLQFVMEFGLIGFSLLSLVVYRLFKDAGGLRTTVRLAWTESHIAMLAAILLGLLAYAMIDGLLYHAIALLHFAVLTALLFAALRSATTPCSTAAPAQPGVNP